MSSSGNVKTTQIELIQSIDLSQVGLYFTCKKGWNVERVEQAINDYRLFLSKVDSTSNLVPLGDVDEIWHRHILNTKKYANDCMRVFGKFVHHEPFEINLSNVDNFSSGCGGSTNCQVSSCSNGDGSDND